MKIGKVKYFHAKKKFGYIDVPDEPAVVFHLFDGRRVVPGERGVKFSEERVSRHPIVGEEVCFFAKLSVRALDRPISIAREKRFRANPWGFASDYEQALRKQGEPSIGSTKPAP